MPRYFFDIHDGARLSVDDEGLDLETDALRGETLRTLPEIARDELPDGAERTFWIRVRDEHGSCIFEASLQMKSGWLRD